MASASTSLGCVGGVPFRGQGKQQKRLRVLGCQVLQTRGRRRRTTSLRRSCLSSLRYKQEGGAGFSVGSQPVSYSWRLRATEGESKSESEQEVTSGTKPETTFSMFCLCSSILSVHSPLFFIVLITTQRKIEPCRS